VKPENVLLDSDGHIRRADFGISKFVARNYANAGVRGAMPFMAPEVIGNARHARASDWRSVGVIAFKFHVGCLPFRATTQ
jgi:serine/threonine protein kinase